MLQIAIILFREFLEITLLLSLIMAATKDLPRRNFYISTGVAIGLVVSIFFAIFAQKIANFAQGSGEDLVNAIVLSLAVIMIGYTILWMQKHVSELKNNFSQTALNVTQGKSSYYTIVTLVATTVIREGSEIILFCYGVTSSHSYKITDLVLGGSLGVTAGILVGGLFYVGLISFCRKSIFKVTNILLMCVAASMASQIPNFLASANIINSYCQPLWDSSRLLNEHSFFGNLMHMIFGYSDKPNFWQLLFYVATFAVISGLKAEQQKANSVIKSG